MRERQTEKEKERDNETVLKMVFERREKESNIIGVETLTTKPKLIHQPKLYQLDLQLNPMLTK